MQSTVKERLIQFIKYKSLSQKRFEEAVGLSNGYVNNIRRSITEDKLQKIALRYPELNKLWLLTGEGEMLNVAENNAHLVTEHSIDTQPYTTTNNGIRYFKRSDGKLILEAPKVPRNALGSLADDFAGYNIDNESGEKELFEVSEIHHGRYYAFEVDGDSMDDDTVRGFQRGDIVLVRELDKQLWLPKLHINKWKFWVVVFGNNVRLKQIVSQDEKNRTITLHSLNPSPEYTDFTLNLEDVDRLFNVVLKKPKTQSYENF